MSEVSFGIFSVLPPIIAIVLALATKEVLSSLLIGIFSGALIYTSFNLITTYETVFSVMTTKMSDNASMILFLALLGALVAVVTVAGGSDAYGKWASLKIKSKQGACLATVGLGMLIFIDDYFNCLTVGTVMRPVTDKHGISRAKLAYLIDSTAAPICMIAPVSSWAASVIASIGDTGVSDSLSMFMSSIPFNFYAILTIIAILFFSISGKDIGKMRDESLIETSKNESADVSRNMKISENGTVLDLVVPILSLIFSTILSMLYTGGFFDGGISLADAFGDSNVNMSLVYGAFFGILVSFAMYIPRKLVSFNDFMDAFGVGVKSMLPAIMILILAWSIGSICSEDYLNTGEFIGSLMKKHNISFTFLPSIVFIVAGFLAFSTGTAWGTFGILLPILVPIIINMNELEYLPLILGAIFSGSVLGDHCSPISDTTILSSAGSGCDHISHVSTQIPYSLTVASASFVGFITAGITNNVYISFATSLVALAVAIFVAIKITDKKYAELP